MVGKNTVSKSSINKLTLIEPFYDNIFMKGFLQNLYLRPSCYYCAAKAGKAHSDITIADYWGIQNYYPQFDDDKGIGLVLINSEKGEQLYSFLNLDSINTAYEDGLRNNPCIERSVVVPKYRQYFWQIYYKKGIDAVNVIIAKTKPSFLRRCFYFAKKCLRKLLLTTKN